jgi:hypothetical protein
MMVDLKKAPVGAWADYSMSMGGNTMKSRWALVARDANSATIEMSVEGGPAAMMGGKMTMKLVMAPDPTIAEKPIKQMVMQMPGQDPIEMPTNMPNMPTQKFEKPDRKKLVGKETIKVPDGSFKTSHYRDQTDQATIDIWASEQVPPMGLIKVTSTPKPGAKGPGGGPAMPVTMELTGHGKGAKPIITKPGKPFDPAMFGGGMRPGAGSPHPPGGPPPSAPPPSAPAPKK